MDINTVSGANVNPYLRELPLYNNLLAKVNERLATENFSISNEYKVKLSNILSSLTKEQAEHIVLLIIHYYFLTSKDNINPFVKNRQIPLPFGLKENGKHKGCAFDLNALPLNLLIILGTYCGI